MKKFIISLIIASILLLTACSSNNEQTIYQNTAEEETNQENEMVNNQEKIVNIDLSKENYSEYINLTISQRTQTYQFVKSQYRVKYHSNGLVEDIWVSSKLNTSLYSSVKLLNTIYKITTTFEIFVTSQSSIYNFNGAIIIFEFNSNSSTLQLNNNGYTVSSFIVSEQKYNMTGYNYNLTNMDIVKDVLGTVYYYE